MIIAIDFDHCIHDKDHPLPGKKMGPPMPGAVEAIQALSRRYEVYVHTLRASHQDNPPYIVDWLRHYEVPFVRVTAIKPDAEWFIDDKGVRFTTLAETLAFIKQ